MTISDKERYNTSNPAIDMLGLGENPALKPLNKFLIRSQLTFMEKASLADREKAVKILLSRIADYYEVIGYVGPYMSKYSELGYALGEWNTARNMSPWRQRYTSCNRYSWEAPEKIFKAVRYSCFETALLLAVWEIGTEVPESREALKLAGWCAQGALKENCGHYWPSIRNRYGSKSMRKVLAFAIARIDQMTLVSGTGWLGHFVEPMKAAA